jgi:hypothetical protein
MLRAITDVTRELRDGLTNDAVRHAAWTPRAGRHWYSQYFFVSF